MSLRLVEPQHRTRPLIRAHGMWPGRPASHPRRLPQAPHRCSCTPHPPGATGRATPGPGRKQEAQPGPSPEESAAGGPGRQPGAQVPGGREHTGGPAAGEGPRQQVPHPFVESSPGCERRSECSDSTQGPADRPGTEEGLSAPYRPSTGPHALSPREGARLQGELRMLRAHWAQTRALTMGGP